MEVLVTVIGQKLRIATNCKTFVEGTCNFVKFVFSLSDDWAGLATHAQFIQDGNAYNRQLDGSHSVFLPDEIHDGKCELVLYGIRGLTVEISDSAVLNIKKSNHRSDGQEDMYIFATIEEMREYLQI
ncbi:MAG: hypothetical protein Q4E91_12620 [Lachnospiraceae bacterium]|nr:hypothetical protein [Lachnospiraceae bacterium]